MEITIDTGADTYSSLEKISEIKEQSFEITCAEMLSLGSRIFMSSLDKKEDKSTQLLLANVISNNKILSEILHIVFDKDKSNLGVYDAETALELIRRMAHDFAESTV